ncbi:NAD(P)-dependent oxidoreductase [Costertonia aggregata]|uniref:2-hydroxyacid dehydrogenase n=1 Tax=Costertonia aggregata TaxID=343403 RepID=A0A7H9ASZ8_9FLAO|nr:NAD(P)-dependent oxidoreductase [Costertonia aggregata]QLG46574.1 2-hydroxyacid dehydrogenase [Costertonia aggregata]
MKIAIYSCHEFEKKYLKAENMDGHELIFIAETLNRTTIDRANGCEVVSIFSSDKTDKEILKKLNQIGVELIATRSAGTDHIDLKAADEFDMKIANVPEYSPHAIAEHCIALSLALYRKLKPSFNRIGKYNFSLEGHVGREIHTKTVGICGTGDIGEVLVNLFHGFGAKVLLFDEKKNPNLTDKDWAKYVKKETILGECDIISLNLPLNEDTKGFISDNELKAMKDTAILINTGRGGLVNTEEVYNALRNRKLAGFGMDVYENEKGIFYKDLSDSTSKDDLLISLIEMDNVVVTAHQTFLTDTALSNMMRTTLDTIREFDKNENIENLVSSK